MTTVTHDLEFQAALEKLEISQQRAIAALFVANVSTLYDDERIKRVIKLAENPQTPMDELQMAYKAAKAASVETYARCGADGDWQDQAGHFVAKAATACITPSPKDNLAWDVAMQCRMARTCAHIAQGAGSTHDENEQQYQLLHDFIC